MRVYQTPWQLRCTSDITILFLDRLLKWSKSEVNRILPTPVKFQVEEITVVGGQVEEGFYEGRKKKRERAMKTTSVLYNSAYALVLISWENGLITR